MADCKKRIETRRYERLSDLGLLTHAIVRTPAMAPLHRKSDDQIIQELTEVIDGEILLRNSLPRERCQHSDCDWLGTNTVLDSPKARTVHLTWSEDFEMRDGNGNTISGSASYVAYGTFSVQTKIEEDFCDERFGSAARDFYRKIYDPNQPTVAVTPGSDLIKFWGSLSTTERKGLKLGKKK